MFPLTSAVSEASFRQIEVQNALEMPELGPACTTEGTPRLPLHHALKAWSWGWASRFDCDSTDLILIETQKIALGDRFRFARNRHHYQIYFIWVCRVKMFLCSMVLFLTRHVLDVQMSTVCSSRSSGVFENVLLGWSSR